MKKNFTNFGIIINTRLTVKIPFVTCTFVLFTLPINVVIDFVGDKQPIYL